MTADRKNLRANLAAAHRRYFRLDLAAYTAAHAATEARQGYAADRSAAELAALDRRATETEARATAAALAVDRAREAVNGQPGNV